MDISEVRTSGKLRDPITGEVRYIEVIARKFSKPGLPPVLRFAHFTDPEPTGEVGRGYEFFLGGERSLLRYTESGWEGL